MKKIIALTLVLILAVGLFAGCKSSDKGSVYFLNFKPEADSAWQALAKTYTEKTGVTVKVVTTLTAEMAKKDAPTLFQCGNETALDTWKDYCLALDGTEFLNEMTTSDFNIKGEDGKTYCAGYCYEAFGIIVNTELLEKAGHSLDEIKDFASLKAVAEDITAHKDELGFAAFSSAGLDSSSSWRFSGHLANMPLYYEFRDDNVTEQPATITGKYLANYKNIWDLYMNNATCAPSELAAKTGDESRAEFANGKAVFFQNGTWEYSNLTDASAMGFSMDPAKLAMIPIYCGVEGEEKAGLACGTENCWAVNAKASAEDIQATLDFMYWLVTDAEVSRMLVDEFAVMPYKQAAESTCGFLADANAYAAEGNYVMPWVTNFQPNVDAYREAIVAAMNQYDNDPTDANWEQVKTAFVDGWAVQYAAANG